MNLDDEKLQLMRNEKIPTVLLKLGLPAMVGMLVSALYNVVDAYFVGGLGTSQMGAVSISFPIGQIIIGLGVTFGSGAASYISRLFGEDNKEEANRVASTALFTSLLVGMISISISLCFLDRILIGLGATETILPYARDYGFIFIAGSIFSIFSVTVSNIITSEGATRFSMVSLVAGSLLNVILAPVFIYSLGYGVSGAAIATVISQAGSSILYLGYILRRKGTLRYSISNFSFDKTVYWEILKVGIPVFMLQLLTSVSMGLTNTAASNYGDSAVAAVGIVTRILAIGSYVIFGYIRGFQSVAGYNYGAKLYERLRETIDVSLKWTTWFCVISAASMLLFAPNIISAFSKNDLDVISIGSKALRAGAIMFIFYGFQLVYLALFLTMGKAKEAGILSLSRQGIFFIPAILILPNFFGIDGVIFAQPIADILTVLLSKMFIKRLRRFWMTA